MRLLASECNLQVWIVDTDRAVDRIRILQSLAYLAGYRGPIRLQFRNQSINARSIYLNGSELVNVERYSIALAHHLNRWKPAGVAQRQLVKDIGVME
jgi:hypothetical protein